MSLKQSLLAWMRGGNGCFEELALAVFAYQFEKNPPYRRYCEALGRVPEKVASWLEIPAVPTDVFKLEGVGLRCFGQEEIAGYFLTSGTTREVKGRHEYAGLEMVEAAVLGGWRERGLPEVNRPWFFSQRVEAARHSSLVRMFATLARGTEAEWLIDGQGRMDVERFMRREDQGAVEVFGTSLGLLRACELMERAALPEGSWIFETGGSKGLRESLTAEEVREKLSASFGVPAGRILNEYGMTELSSQFYRWGNEETHKGPPWVGVRVVNVETGELAKSGELGYLEIVDLANLETVLAVRTQDLAVAVGEREFVLVGRDPGAVNRGCSRGVEEVLAAGDR
ncbi:MAG: hypothetical protein H7Y36_06290 [Armatimonadetes bacterium]|nr:hypothetical protein [Akkermansiaceae bacterium]